MLNQISNYIQNKTFYFTVYKDKIHIQNYRNYGDFTMNFHKGLNVIIGSNNSGKTGLLYAINLLYSPSSISVDDFNKNNLLKYDELYVENAPEIVIEYYISHRIAEDDFLGQTDRYHSDNYKHKTMNRVFAEGLYQRLYRVCRILNNPIT